MSQNNVFAAHHTHGPESEAEKDDNRPVMRSDLVELVLGPISDQIDRARLEILARIREVSDSVDIIGRQKRREMDR